MNLRSSNGTGIEESAPGIEQQRQGEPAVCPTQGHSLPLPSAPDDKQPPKGRDEKSLPGFADRWSGKEQNSFFHRQNATGCARQQEAIAQFGQRALENVDNSVLLDECVALVAQTLDVESCAVWEHAPAQGELVIQTNAGLGSNLARATLRVGADSPAARVLRGRKPLIVEDMGLENMAASADGTPAPEALCGASSISVLINGQNGSEPFGVLQAHSRQPRTFTQDDIFFMQAVANVAANSIARVRHAETLRLAETRYRRIASNTPGMVYQFRLGVDGTFSFPFASEGCREMFGVEPHEIYADPMVVIGILHEEDRSTLFPAILASAQTMEQFHWLGRYLSSAGKVGWMRADSRPERQADGSVIWDGMMFDVSELKEAQQALSAAKEEAERANRAKSDFLSRMSHELRTPLNAILGFGEFLQGQETREIPRDCLGHIVKAGSHLLGLINEVLDISRIESGNIPLNIQPIQAGRVIEETLDLIRGIAHEHRIKLRWTRTGDAERCVLADTQRLKQVLLNLLSNAVKYNVEGGGVNVACMVASDERICLEVTDTGLGIACDKLNRLFVAFDRMGAENSGVQGTGLGLALSKCLVEALGGTIEVESELGIGTTFRVFLPAAPKEMSDAVASGGARRGQGAAADSTGEDTEPSPWDEFNFSREYRVLYIEDNDLNYRLVQRLLGEYPQIALSRGATAVEGLKLLAQDLPDLLLLDLHLPDLSGDKVLEKLRLDPRTRDLPIIVMSADATQASIDCLLRGGADAYITKPIDLQQMLGAMHKMLEGRSVAAGRI